MQVKLVNNKGDSFWNGPFLGRVAPPTPLVAEKQISNFAAVYLEDHFSYCG